MSITAEGDSSKAASVLIEEQMIPHQPVPAPEAYGWVGGGVMSMVAEC